jgi:signal peptidase II
VRNPILFGLVILILDQFTKFLVDKFIMYASILNIISFVDFFNITNVRNTGTAFSVFQDKNLLFSIIVSFLLLGLSIWLYKNWSKINRLQHYAFCLVVMAGLGNFIDRLFRGAVVDFLDFGIYSLRCPAFNIADSCICIATSIIVIDAFIFNSK